MKNLFYSVLVALALVSCAKEEEVDAPPAPNKYTLAISAENGGADVNMPSEGVLVYTVDTSIASGEGTIKVLPYDPYNETKFDLLLKEGGQFSYEGFNIKVVYTEPSFDRVVITKN